jgi:hypothetical protein
MVTAALSVIAKKCKKPICPSTLEWINKMWYNGILFCNRNEVLTCYNVEKPWKHAKREKPDAKNFMWCDWFYLCDGT